MKKWIVIVAVVLAAMSVRADGDFPVEGLRLTGPMNAGGQDITNAANVSATTVTISGVSRTNWPSGTIPTLQSVLDAGNSAPTNSMMVSNFVAGGSITLGTNSPITSWPVSTIPSLQSVMDVGGSAPTNSMIVSNITANGSLFVSNSITLGTNTPISNWPMTDLGVRGATGIVCNVTTGTYNDITRTLSVPAVVSSQIWNITNLTAAAFAALPVTNTTTLYLITP